MKIRGEKLAEIRNAAFVSRSELATAAELSQVRVWQIESNEISDVKEATVLRIAKKLKVKPEDLF